MKNRKASFEYIALIIGADESQHNLTWYSNAEKDSAVQVVLTSDMADGCFPLSGAAEFRAKKNVSTITGWNIFETTITGLKPSNKYVYRMGNDEEGWSKMYSFATQRPGDFSFLFAGDPQIATARNEAQWTHALNKAISEFPNTCFLLMPGDHVDTPTDKTVMEQEYKRFFSPEILRSLPMATTRGNHEMTMGDAAAFDPHREHFNNQPNLSLNPNGAPFGEQYWYTYNGVLFISLDFGSIYVQTNRPAYYASAKAFMAEVIAQNQDAKWTVVFTHYSLFASGTSYAAQKTITSDMAPVFSELEVDVVLTGHDHFYTRTYMMQGTVPITTPEYYSSFNSGIPSGVTNPQRGQVLYVTANTSSGVKHYDPHEIKKPWAAVSHSKGKADNSIKTADISHVKITDTSFKITTYSANYTDNTYTENGVIENWNVIDEFEISRQTEDFKYRICSKKNI